MASQLALALDPLPDERPAYLTDQLVTYIGNKRALLPLIAAGLDRARALLGVEQVSFLDLFAGSGIVSRYAKRIARRLVANDLEPYAAVVGRCFLSNAGEVDQRELDAAMAAVKARQCHDPAPGFLTRLYAPADEARITEGDRVFYTRANATFLDSACRALADTPAPYRDLLLGPMLSAASVHANTSGVFKGFYKDGAGKGKFGGSGGDALSRILRPIGWRKPILSAFERPFEVCQRDANTLVREIERVDVAYLDPPYNQHPYGSNYFMLNLLVDYREPAEISRVSGIPTDWQRSAYNKRAHSQAALFDAIAHCPADIVLLSYSSEGFVPLDAFHRQLVTLGRVEMFDTQYNIFRGCRNLHARDHLLREFLFLVDKR